jgi:AAHS family 4-hydroxybenzoate transporter-like MFS transporter
MLGVGRMGAVAGALTGGVMMSIGLPFSAVFMLLSLPAFLAAVALFALGRSDVPSYEPSFSDKVVISPLE